MNNVDKFLTLFTGLDRVRMTWSPGKNGSPDFIDSKKEPLIRKHYEEHLNGGLGILLPMVMEDGKCYFGAVDVDDHTESDLVDFVGISKKIHEMDLPLITCRSKRGGAHLYMFCDPPISAGLMQDVLKVYAGQLGVGGSEIFPKQRKGPGPDGVGNGINIPYYDCENTNRFAVANGKQLTLEEFIIFAEGIVQKEVAKPNNDSGPTAPPCLLSILDSGGIKEGERNEGLFNFGVYYRKSFPEIWEDKLMGLNYSQVNPPLPKREVEIIIKQVGRSGGYNYKCNVDPVMSYCDRTTCLTRKYGIKANPGEAMEVSVGELKKVLSKPPRWVITVNGQLIEVSTAEIMNWEAMRARIMEQADIIAPPFKKNEWLDILSDRMSSKIDIEAPDDASIAGAIGSRLIEFCTNALGATLPGEKIIQGDRKMIARGQPQIIYANLAVSNNEGTRREQLMDIGDESKDPFVVFRGPDFVEFLKKRKSEEVKGQMLWSILRNLGCGHQKMRIGTGPSQIWFLKADPEWIQDFSSTIIETKDEF